METETTDNSLETLMDVAGTSVDGKSGASMVTPSESESKVKVENLPTSTHKLVKLSNSKSFLHQNEASGEPGDFKKYNKVLKHNHKTKKHLLVLLEEMKEEISKIAEDKEINEESDEQLNLSDKPGTNRTTYDLSGTTNLQQESLLALAPPHSLQKQLDTFLNENKTLKSNLQDKEHKIIELAAKYEDMFEKFQKTQEEIKLLEAKLAESPASSLSLETSTETMQFTDDSEPQSLPVLGHSGNETLNFVQKTRALELSIKKYEVTVKKLKDMNFQWQLYNKQKQEEFRKQEQTLQEKNRLINQLTSRIDSEPSNSVSFSPAQQNYIDDSLQRLRREADTLRDQRDTTAQDARRNLAAAKLRQEDAEKKATDLQKRVDELNSQLAAQTEQLSEFRTALVVATRSQQQDASYSSELTSMKEAARQCQEELSKLESDYKRVVAENQRLEQQLRQAGPRFRSTILNHSGSGTTTIRSSNDGRVSEIFSNETFPSVYDDIEIDSASPSSCSMFDRNRVNGRID